MANLIGTAGHVDHGKTTLIQALTGIDTDRLPEEKRRGLTIDIGFAYVDLPDLGRVSIVDVPGHEKFLTNMLVGALGIDVALLCVAADESVMPQTIEHFLILELLPVDRMVVALTRRDLVDEETAEFAAEEVKELLENTRFKDSPIVPVSAIKGTGLDELKTELVKAIKQQGEPSSGPWYLPIDRVFSIKGHGVVVTGTLAQGKVKEGDKAIIMPEGHDVRVRSIQSHDEPSAESEKGKRTALNLGGIKAEEVHRGQAVGSPGVLFSSEILDAKVKWIKNSKHGARIRVSLGSDEVIAKIFLNDHEPELIQLRFERPVVAAKGQPLIIRQYSPSVLLAGGKVTVPEAVVRRKSEQTTTIDDSLSESDAIVAMIAGNPHGVLTENVCRTVGKSVQALGTTFEALKKEGKLFGFAGLWLTAENFKLSTDELKKALQAQHNANPTKLFHPREKALSTAGIKWSGKPLDRIVTYLTETDVLRSQGTNISLADFKIQFSARQRAMLDQVINVLDQAKLSVPSPDQISRDVNVPPQAIAEIIKIGVSAGELIRIEEGIYYSSNGLQKITEILRNDFAGKQFSASEFRGHMDSSRKFAIPILEYFDAKGVTKRMGDTRVVL